MNLKSNIICIAFLFVSHISFSQIEFTNQQQWKGKTVAFLGDSMTDKNTLKNTILYWEYLSEMLGIKPISYGISGHQWTNIHQQAIKLKADEVKNLDAIIIFAGTNDYNSNVAIGEFFDETEKETNANGITVKRKYRTFNQQDSTFCGRLNNTLSYLKKSFPDQQIIIITPIHRGFAKFSANNIQPDEQFANGKGLFIHDYVEVLKKASAIWSVPVVDAFSITGLFPLEESHYPYFANERTDLLHLNQKGHLRLAKTLYYQLLTLPSTFK